MFQSDRFRRVGFLVIVGIIAVLGLLPARASADFKDDFDTFNYDNWTTQPSGLRFIKEKPYKVVSINDGVAVFGNESHNCLITSRRKFLYGTFEAKVRYRPHAGEYIGFASRSPWQANALICNSFTAPEGSGWHFVVSKDAKGGATGLDAPVPANQWCELKLVWEASRAAFYVDGQLKGEITDASRIPQIPLPITIDDDYGSGQIEVDWISVTGESPMGSGQTLVPPSAPTLEGKSVTLQSSDWKVVIDGKSGITSECSSLRPTAVRWNPEDAAGVDLYVRDVPSGDPIRFTRDLRSPTVVSKSSFECKMSPVSEPFNDSISANLQLRLSGAQLKAVARLTALRDIDHPVEIGLGLPFRPEIWKQQLFASLPWLAIWPQQDSDARFSFMNDTNDATVATFTGAAISYPMGLLQGTDRTVLWGGMDIGKRVVLSPNNCGSLPAVTFCPKTWPKGKTLELTFVANNFTGAANDMPQILRWYLSHCTSSDALTKDLFPVKQWKPRVFPDGGGVGMPDLRQSWLNPKVDKSVWELASERMLECSVPNLWLAHARSMDGAYPTSGAWLSTLGLPLTAESLKAEIARIKASGLRPCLYTSQWLVPELLKDGGIPDKKWITYQADGSPNIWDTYTVGDARNDWFTKEIADKVGVNTITWALADYGNAAYRDWLEARLKVWLDYYQPSGICYDYGWAGALPGYSTADPQTTQAHGMLKVQADMWKWMRVHHPEMVVIVNDGPGSPSQLFCNCSLLESSDVYSDVDYLAGKALGSAMSNMDYFGGHDRATWTRQFMFDLARGCSFGAPAWELMGPPDWDYLQTWKVFFDFSGRTTKLPIVPSENSVTSPDGNIVGTVWTDGKSLMSVAFDRRTEGSANDTTVHIRIPKSIAESTDWKLVKLDNLNVPVPGSGWKAERVARDAVDISGSFSPGEMILVEAVKK